MHKQVGYFMFIIGTCGAFYFGVIPLLRYGITKGVEKGNTFMLAFSVFLQWIGLAFMKL